MHDFLNLKRIQNETLNFQIWYCYMSCIFQNEERACILRILVHIYLPAVLRLIASFAGKVENLKLIQRWIWKEIELTKTKFDDLCSPLFANPPMELSPDARGYIHHARAFFHRACLILEALMVHVEALNDEGWLAEKF